MNYIELEIIFTKEDTIQKEIITADLADLGYESFIEDDKVLKAYTQEEGYHEAETSDYLKQYADLRYTVKRIEQQNWNQEWENNYQPIVYEDKCLVRATFHEVDKEYPVEIIIDPKMSFGTGHHETTSLIVREMFDLELKGKTVLDMGTGTGILAILASKLGAKDITAIDNDEWSYENSIENTQKNNTSNVEVLLGDASSIPSKKYEIILANINRNILLEDMKYYVKHLTGNSTLLLSGVYKDDIEALNNEAEKYGLEFICNQEKNNWVSIKYKKA